MQQQKEKKEAKRERVSVWIKLQNKHTKHATMTR